MTEINQNYRCNICGNLVKIIQSGQGALVCCGQPMELMVETAAAQTIAEEMPPAPETPKEETVEPINNNEPTEPPTTEENQGI